MSALAQWIRYARETVVKATPGPVRTAGGYLTTRNPNGSSFVRSVFHLDELGQEVRANYSGPFQAIPFHRAEDAAKAALGWNALSALLDRYAAFNRPLAVTALGVPSAALPPAPPAPGEEGDPFEGGSWRYTWSPELQADWASQARAMIAAKPYVQSICWQQLGEGLPSGDDMPSGGLCAPSGTNKPVLQRFAQVRRALRDGKGIQGIPNLGVF